MLAVPPPVPTAHEHGHRLSGSGSAVLENPRRVWRSSMSGNTTLRLGTATQGEGRVMTLGHPPWRPRARAASRPAVDRSRIKPRSNSARAANRCSCRRPVAVVVVVSMFSRSDRNAICRSCSPPMTSIRFSAVGGRSEAHDRPSSHPLGQRKPAISSREAAPSSRSRHVSRGSRSACRTRTLAWLT